MTSTKRDTVKTNTNRDRIIAFAGGQLNEHNIYKNPKNWGLKHIDVNSCCMCDNVGAKFCLDWPTG